MCVGHLEFRPLSDFFISSEILTYVIDDHCLVQHGCTSDPLAWLTFCHPASDFSHPEPGSHHAVFEVRFPYTNVTCRRACAGLCKLSTISKPQKFRGLSRWNCTEVDVQLPIESLQFGPKTCPTSRPHVHGFRAQHSRLASLRHNMQHSGTTCLVQGCSRESSWPGAMGL